MTTRPPAFIYLHPIATVFTSLLLIVHHQVMQNCRLGVVRSRLNFTASPWTPDRPQHIHFLQALAHIHFLGKPHSTPPVLLANPCILLLRSDRLHRPIRSFRGLTFRGNKSPLPVTFTDQANCVIQISSSTICRPLCLIYRRLPYTV